MARNPGQGQVHQRLDGRLQEGRPGGGQPQRQARDRRRQGPRARALRVSPTARTCRCARARSVEPGQELVVWDPFTSAILTEIAGTVEFHDIVEGENVREETDKVTGLSQRIIVEASASEKRAPAMLVRGRRSRAALPAAVRLPPGGQRRRHGPSLATPWSRSRARPPRPRTSPAGLPRVVELFEARTPKEPAIISEIDGTVRLGDIHKGMRKVDWWSSDTQRGARVLWCRATIHVNVQEGERVARRRASDRRPDQPPRRPARCLGEKELERYLVDKIQEVYRSQIGGDQRQAHRGHRAPDDAFAMKIEEVGDTDLPDRRAGRPLPLPGRERARGRGRRQAPADRPAAACSASPRPRCRPRASSRRLQLPGDDAGPDRGGDRRQDRLSCAGSRRTSSSAASSRRVPA